jgi:hypothetical protein
MDFFAEHPTGDTAADAGPAPDRSSPDGTRAT